MDSGNVERIASRRSGLPERFSKCGYSTMFGHVMSVRYAVNDGGVTIKEVVEGKLVEALNKMVLDEASRS